MAAQTAERPQQIYTEARALHLVRVLGSVLSVMFLLGWQHLMMLNPLKQEKLIMEHMDPSEIIDIPFPIDKLTTFTMFPVVIIMMVWLVRTPSKLSRKLLSLTKLTLVVYALFALCGDNIVKNWKHSVTAALYLASLLSTSWTDKETSNTLAELPFTDPSDLMTFCRLYGIILVSIPFHVLGVLDHGHQIQRWPLPVVLGGTYGYVIGTLIGLVGYSLVTSSKARKSS